MTTTANCQYEYTTELFTLLCGQGWSIFEYLSEVWVWYYTPRKIALYKIQSTSLYIELSCYGFWWLRHKQRILCTKNFHVKLKVKIRLCSKQNIFNSGLLIGVCEFAVFCLWRKTRIFLPSKRRCWHGTPLANEIPFVLKMA